MDEIFQNIGNKLTLSQRIEQTIESAIREKKLVVGSKLPTEKEMCESFGVSRTALREAVRRLSARGLITIQKGSGMYVSEIRIEDAIKSLNLYYDLRFDKDLLLRIIEVRGMIEPEIARLSALNRTEEHIAELEKNMLECENCDPENSQLEADLDCKFHLWITRSTSNPILRVNMEPIYSLLPRIRGYINGNIEGEKQETVNDHRRILEAIMSKKDERAKEAMKEHIERTRKIYESHMTIKQ